MRGTVACSTDHRLVRSVMHQRRKKARSSTSKSYKIAPKRIELHERHSTRPVGVLPVDANVDELWEALECVIHKACTETIRHTSSNHQDWFDENNVEIQNLLDLLRVAETTLLPMRSDRNINASKRWPKEHSCHQKQMVGIERQGDRGNCRPKRHSKLLPRSKSYLWAKLKWPHSTLDGTLLKKLPCHPAEIEGALWAESWTSG